MLKDYSKLQSRNKRQYKGRMELLKKQWEDLVLNYYFLLRKQCVVSERKVICKKEKSKAESHGLGT